MPIKPNSGATNHLFVTLPLALGLTFGSGAALADAATPDTHRNPPLEAITRDMHPSGPTIRHEWKHSTNATPIRIEIEGARSGALLIGQVRLQHQPDGVWAMVTTTPAGEITQTIALGTQHPTRVKASGYRWKVEVLKETTVTPQPGIATEAEPSLDLRITRLGKL